MLYIRDKFSQLHVVFFRNSFTVYNRDRFFILDWQINLTPLNIRDKNALLNKPEIELDRISYYNF